MDRRALQQRLTELGFDPGPIDGLQGARTIAATKAFQASRGLVADGVVGPRTLAALEMRPHDLASAPALVSSVCVDLVKAWEGIEDGNPQTVLLDPYVCPAGVVTVGWGHVLLDERGRQIKPSTHGGKAAALAAGARALTRLFGGPAITRDQAKALLAVDLNAFAAGVARLLTGGAVGKVGQSAFDACVSLAFNIGLGGFETSSVRRLVLRGDPVPASLSFSALQFASRSGKAPADLAQAFGAWSKGGGEWLLGLFRRRMCEAMVCRGDALDTALARARAIQEV